MIQWHRGNVRAYWKINLCVWLLWYLILFVYNWWKKANLLMNTVWSARDCNRNEVTKWIICVQQLLNWLLDLRIVSLAKQAAELSKAIKCHIQLQTDGKCRSIVAWKMKMSFRSIPFPFVIIWSFYYRYPIRHTRKKILIHASQVFVGLICDTMLDLNLKIHCPGRKQCRV